MSRRGRWIRIGAILAMLLVGVPRIGCQRASGLDDALSSIAGPYRFSILRWQLSQILGRPEPAGQQEQRGAVSFESSEPVVEYFSLVDQARTARWEADAIAAGVLEGDLAIKLTELENLQTRRDALTDSVRRILAWQIRDILNRQGIFNPLDRLLQVGVGFPPVNFRLDRPPNVLIVSPRERVESIREIMLVQHLDQDQFEDIEASVDELGVSSLVTELGGFGGTYPTFVAGDGSLAWTIATATEEWLHQYLAFTPLGFMYLLDSIGIARNYEIATINETVAGIVSGEIGGLVMAAYYPQYTAPSGGGSSSGEGFDFNRTMRELRLAVDELLANGEIERAERLMEERRQLLVSKGYSIRKLNQAYFAFYGTYADEPTSVSPIGTEVSELRRGSVSLRDFLNRAAAMTSRQDLINRLQTPSDEGGLLVRSTGFGRAADMHSPP